jgi:hypothetical protein
MVNNLIPSTIACATKICRKILMNYDQAIGGNDMIADNWQLAVPIVQ